MHCKKVRKITEYIGSIDQGGIFRKKREGSRIQESGREVFEYGNGALAHHMIKDLEDLLAKNTPYCNELIATAIIKAIDPKPLRLFASRWEKLYLSKLIDASLTLRHLSSVLSSTGRDIHIWYV